MLIANLGILGIFEDKRSRYWEWTKNDSVVSIANYLTGTIPSLTFITDVMAPDSVPAYSISLYDCNDVLLQSDIATPYYFVSPDLDYIQVLYNNSFLEGMEKGYYYLKITLFYNGEEYASYFTDVFKWVDSTEGMLKISAHDMTDVKVGKFKKYLFNLHLMTFELSAYFDCDYDGVANIQKETANDDYAVTSILYASTSIERSWNLLCNESMLIFLRYLRVLGGNGTVTVTSNYKDYNAIDILSETGSNETDGAYIVKFTFKDEGEIISMCNDIVE